MWPVDAVSDQERTRRQALRWWAGRFSLDERDADDVMAAVSDYTRLRHPGLELPSFYLGFLLARSASGRRQPLTPAWRTALEEDASPELRLLLGALACADEPAVVFDAYRRQLVAPTRTDLHAPGWALRLDLSRVVVQAQEDLLLMWIPVLDQLARWAAIWRTGNPTVLDQVHVRGLPAAATGGDRLRDRLIDRMHNVEQINGLPPAKWVWMDG